MDKFMWELFKKHNNITENVIPRVVEMPINVNGTDEEPEWEFVKIDVDKIEASDNIVSLLIGYHLGEDNEKILFNKFCGRENTDEFFNLLDMLQTLRGSYKLKFLYGH